MAIPKKPRQCRVCKTMFQPVRCLQTVCSPECAIEQAKAKRTKAERVADIAARKTIRMKLEHLKTKGDYAKEAQTVFNQYIRERDKNLPCISCGRHHQGQYHAGHLLSVGAHPELRFDERNVNKQCQPCNTHKHGNIIEYQKGLIKKIGIDEYNSLMGYHKPKHYSVDDLINIRDNYKRKLKELKKCTL